MCWMKPFKYWSWLSETFLISVAAWCCTMALPHVVFLPGSMQTGQHSPTGVKGKWQCTMGQVISSQTTRPPVHRQVTQGFGDQTACSNMVRPWYTHWPCLPETTQIRYSQIRSSKSLLKGDTLYWEDEGSKCHMAVADLWQLSFFKKNILFL